MSQPDVALNKAVLLVNPEDKTVLVIDRANVVSYPGYLCVGGARSSVLRMYNVDRLLTLYIAAWHAVGVHGISMQDVDAALRVVPEYRETLETDFPTAVKSSHDILLEASRAAEAANRAARS